MTSYIESRRVVGPLFRNRASRHLLLDAFNTEVISALDTGSNLTVAVVGGTSNEPEVALLRAMGFSLTVDVLGIDNYDIKFDLNERVSNRSLGKYDLVLCSQVLEHVWNLPVALLNLTELISQHNGILWLNFPRSNREHGLPNWFYAGISDAAITHLLHANSRCSVEASGSLGSKRLYFMTHVLPTWPSDKALRWPVIFGFDELSIFRRVANFVFHFPLLLLAQLVPNKISKSASKFHTETYVLVRSSADSSGDERGSRKNR